MTVYSIVAADMLKLPLLLLAAAAAVSPLTTLQKIPPDTLRLVVAQGSPVAAGLNGRNRTMWISVGAQNGAMQPLIYAAVRGDAAVADTYWPVVVESFKHQNSDGSFQYASVVDGKPFDTRGLPTDAAFWLSQSAYALLLLQTSSLGPKYQARIEALRGPYRLAETWLARPGNLALMEFVDSGATNRLLIDAQALLLSNMLAPNNDASAAGQSLLSLALSAQSPEGFFREHGGPDTSYNAVSCLTLEQIALFYTSDPRLLPSVQRCAKWEMGRIDANGRVSTEGNTRTGPSFRTAAGAVYSIDSYRIAQMLAVYGALVNDDGALAIARRVILYYKTHRDAD